MCLLQQGLGLLTGRGLCADNTFTAGRTFAPAVPSAWNTQKLQTPPRSLRECELELGSASCSARCVSWCLPGIQKAPSVCVECQPNGSHRALGIPPLARYQGFPRLTASVGDCLLDLGTCLSLGCASQGMGARPQQEVLSPQCET